MKGKRGVDRISFSRIHSVIDFPDLLGVQLKSFREFLQADVPPGERERKGLQAVFMNMFPIVDNREEYILEFVEYRVDKPKYTVAECRERGVTYSAPLKAKLRLSVRDESDEKGVYANTVESEVYLGNLPLMTDQGTFIINGAVRVVVSQLHRSPGVFFDVLSHPNGTKLYSARIIPFRGPWIEMTTDINDVLYVYVDRRRKFPLTAFLRAIGFPSNLDILKLLDLVEEVELAKKDIHKFYGRPVVGDVADKETGEIVLEEWSEFNSDALAKCKKANIQMIFLAKKKKKDASFDVIYNTIRKDKTEDQEQALKVIYRELRANQEAPDVDTAKKLVERYFFDEKRYDLGQVGRYKINKKLNLNIADGVTVLTIEDIVAIIKYVLALKNGQQTTDDIDHLGNRRIRLVGEQLANQHNVALARMARMVRERMNLRDTEQLTPQDLVNVRAITSVINTFFGTNQLSQFLDQVNPLAELTHKRRMSALGPGGLTRERAGFEVRDVHYTHYGRLCPIETPEGPNIGLISSLCTLAMVNSHGFLETPYRVVQNGRVTRKIAYLTADEEDRYTIAQANAPLTESGHFKRQWVKARIKGDFPVVAPSAVDFMDVSPRQIVSVAAALIPFLEHDDANRALMGSNMQRQAVPLLKPEVPLVGTGIEAKAARDSRTLLLAGEDGVVEKVSAQEIVVRRGDSFPSVEPKSTNCPLTKFFRTNQNTCINQRPMVEIGDRVKAGDVLADGCATQWGELALGRNVLVAFMPWRGYNFEDAIVISERLIQNDTFTSIHIVEKELEVREMKRGEEELTREIPNVSEEAIKDLDERGIIRVGAEVQPGDILIGKITPKGETDLKPEDKLLKAIFGDKAGEVKDASLKAPPGLSGIVIETKLFSRKKKDVEARKEDKKKIEELEKKYEEDNWKRSKERDQRLIELLVGKTAWEIESLPHHETLVKKGEKLTKKILEKLDFGQIDETLDWTDEEDTNELRGLILEEFSERVRKITVEFNAEKYKIQIGDELPPGISQLVKVYIAKKRRISVGDKMAGRHGNKGVVAKIVPASDMPYMSDGTPVDIILNPLGVPSRMNLGQIYETALGWAAKELGLYFATPVFDGASLEDVKQYLEKANLPRSGKCVLYDGLTGEPFDQVITVGYIYMMKLSHLVDDKIHARSIGPYSLITQQPLGGKAQFGGQRFGEMEVWALEAYGAAHILQELLTVKSDDVWGRARAYEALVKGENLPVSGIPESFNVLVNELRGLGLEVEFE